MWSREGFRWFWRSLKVFEGFWRFLIVFLRVFDCFLKVFDCFLKVFDCCCSSLLMFFCLILFDVFFFFFLKVVDCFLKVFDVFFKSFWCYFFVWRCSRFLIVVEGFGKSLINYANQSKNALHFEHKYSIYPSKPYSNYLFSTSLGDGVIFELLFFSLANTQHNSNKKSAPSKKIF